MEYNFIVSKPNGDKDQSCIFMKFITLSNIDFWLD